MNPRSNTVVILPTLLQTWLNTRVQVAVDHPIDRIWVEHDHLEETIRVLTTHSLSDFYVDNPGCRVIALWLPSLSVLETDNLFTAESKPYHRACATKELDSMIEQAEKFSIPILNERYLNVSVLDDLCEQDFNKYYNSGNFNMRGVA